MINWKKIMTAIVAVACMTVIFGCSTVSARTKNVKIDLTGGATPVRRPAALDKAKKVKIKCSKNSVVKVRYKRNKKDRRIVFTGKKKGTSMVTVKCSLKNGKTKTYKYKVKVIRSKKVTSLDKAKQAFKIQNQYRREKGVADLEWSDEIYQFCLYRLKTSGYDEHKNLEKDKDTYFGLYSQYKKLLFGENLYSGSADAKTAMAAWKKSAGHYKNLLQSSYVCGAIACYKNTWCAVFFSGDKSELENWRSHQIKEIIVKRYDSGSETYISGCGIGYYEADDRWGSLQAAMITGTSGKVIYLEVGKTYVIYERKTPDGYGKAENVTITVTEDGASEVILTD